MSEICEFCSKGFNSKNLLYNHQKRTQKCVKLQLEKLGKPACEFKKEEKKKIKEATYKGKKEDKTENESGDESEDEIHNESNVSESEESNFESEMDFTSDGEEIVEKRSNEVVKVINHDIKELKKDLFTTTTRKEEKKEEVKKEEKSERLDKLEKEVGDIKSMLIRIEKILVKKDDEFMEFIKTIRLDMESKNETLEILREEFDNMADNYYDIYKKFKYIKEDMEEMVEEKRGGSKRGSRR